MDLNALLLSVWIKNLDLSPAWLGKIDYLTMPGYKPLVHFSLISGSLTQNFLT